MKKREYIFVAIVVILGIALVWQQVRLMAQSKAMPQPMQVFGCSANARDIRVKQGEDDNIKKGVWKESDRETLDQIVSNSNDGLHVCIAVDPNTNRRYTVAFYGIWDKAAAISIIEQK